MKNRIKYSAPSSVVKEPKSMYWESKVRFSLRNCSIDRKYCVSKLNKQELLRLYKTLHHFEEMSFKTLDALPRAGGLTSEISNSYSFNLLKTNYPLYSNFGHFRVDGTGLSFRVFCARYDDLLCLLYFDREGSIHH